MKEKFYLLNLFKEKFNRNLTVYENGKHLFSTGEELSKDKNFSFEKEYNGEKYVVTLEGDGESVKKNSAFLEILLFGDERKPVNDKTDLIVRTLKGEKFTIKEYEKYFSFDKNCVVLVIDADGKDEAVTSFLSLYDTENSFFVTIDGYCVLTLFSFSGKDYLSVGKYAEVLFEAIKEELGLYVKIGYGTSVENLSFASLSYRQAVRALENGKIFGEKNVYSYLEYLPIKTLKNLDKTEKNILLKSYEKVIKEKDLILTADEFLNCDLNVRKASKKLFIHRNTLYYRLDKIESITGLDIRKFSQATIFKMLTILCKIEENEND